MEKIAFDLPDTGPLIALTSAKHRCMIISADGFLLRRSSRRCALAYVATESEGGRPNCLRNIVKNASGLA